MLNKDIINKSYVKYLLVFFASCFVFTIIQFSFNGLLGVDGYYNAKIASMMIEYNDVVRDFPWMNFSILKDNFVEHHLLYHILLTPFIALFSPILGMKIATIIFSSLATTAFYWLINKLKYRFPIFWTSAFLFSSGLFLFRLNLPRAQGLSLALLFIGIYALIKKRYRTLFIISLLYAWLFDGFIILGLVTILFITPSIFQKRFSTSFKLLATFLGGTACALIINPYFPENIKQIYFHIVNVAFSNPFSSLPVGTEWQPPSINQFIVSSPLYIIVILIVSAHSVYFIINKKCKLIFWRYTILSFIFLILSIITIRMVEYCLPLIILFLAYLSSTSEFKHFQLSKFQKSIAWLIITISLAYTLSLVINDAKNDEDDMHLKEASAWLRDNTENGEVIFNTNWSDFPLLFFYNDQNYYINGLDPNFMYRYDIDLYNKWAEIFSITHPENIYSTVKYDFDSNYIFASSSNSELWPHLEADPRIIKVFDNTKSRIYKLK